jgi:hypothetical protein
VDRNWYQATISDDKAVEPMTKEAFFMMHVLENMKSKLKVSNLLVDFLDNETMLQAQQSQCNTPAYGLVLHFLSVLCPYHDVLDLRHQSRDNVG